MHLVRDPAAFEEFYRRHVDGVTRFVARRITDPHLVADVTAEVFLAMLDSADTYRPGRGSETAWLYGIARNAVSAEWRRAARESRANARVAGRRLLEPDDVVRLEERIDAEAAARRHREALAGLPEGERAVLELVVVDQLTVSEAAKALGIGPVAARVRLHRARKTLRAAAKRAEQQGGLPGSEVTSISYMRGNA
ncbi:RNA polymerase sigma factor [Streptomyces cavernae]|uniref:RNA polymerase sigma factor n=1 Tax=Streptomyces cavernae TaxID=2259034 RepID=UPI000FEBB0B3|nr:RNA polymerase sigma factor [Streptomyces cavernae]